MRTTAPLRALALLVAAGCTTASAPETSPMPVASSGAAEAPRPSPPAAPARSEPGDEAPAALRGLVDAHNRRRAAHCATPLAWSSELAAIAQRHAERLRAGGCNLLHSTGPYGENLFSVSPAGAATPDEVVDDWYNEIAAYDFRRPGFSMRTGHFTQVVWKGTARLGCAAARCADAEVWVCNYDPPGNVADHFAANVAPTGCR